MPDERDTRDQPGSWLPTSDWTVVKDDGGHEVSRITECDRHGPFRQRLYQGINPPDWADRKGSNFIMAAIKPFIGDWWSKCPSCNIEIGEEQEAFRKEAIYGEEERKRLRKLMAEEAGIDPRYAEAEPFTTMKSFHPKMTPVINKVRDYCTNWDQVNAIGQCLVLYGGYGTGKTFASCAIANYVISKGGSARYITAERIAETVRSTFSSNTETELEAMEAMVSPDLLVIDEIGRYNATDLAAVKLQRVLDSRYGKRKPTVLCTNLSKDQLKATVTSAMFDRLRESGGQLLAFTWESLRAREDLND